MKLALFVLCGLLVSPGLAAAYEVTDSNVTRLSDDTVLFSVTYRFGFLNREMLMPLATQYGTAETSDRVSYTISAGGETLATPYAPAIVLTSDEDVTLRDGQYHLPEGRNAEFTFYSFLRLEEDTPTNGLHAEITHLPYTMINVDKDSMSSGAVLPTEISDYRTPSLTLGSGLSIVSQTATVEVKK